MIPRIDALIITILPREPRLDPTKRLRHEIALPAWEQLAINAINLLLHRARHLRIHLGKHSAKTLYPARPLYQQKCDLQPGSGRHGARVSSPAAAREIADGLRGLCVGVANTLLWVE